MFSADRLSALNFSSRLRNWAHPVDLRLTSGLVWPPRLRDWKTAA